MKKSFLIPVIAFLLISGEIFAQTISTLVNDPSKRFEALHWHEDGRIYAADYFNGRLYQVHTDGTVETLLSGFSALAGGGFDAEGNFYIAGINSGEMLMLNPDNSTLTIADGFNQPVSLLQSNENEDLFYVTEYQTHKVSTFLLSTGEVSPYVANSGLNGPDGLIHGWNGDLLVANWNNHKIHRIDPDGNITLFSDLGLPGNMGYITLIGDYVYVPSATGKQVYKVDMDGNATAIAGTGSAGSADGDASEATFTKPNGICHNQAGDTILVGDLASIRILTGFDSTVGLDEVDVEIPFQLSPNPSRDYLNVRWKSNTQNRNSRWEIYSTQGQLMDSGYMRESEGQGNMNRIELDGLGTGTYIFRVIDKNSISSERPFVVAD